MITLLFFPQQQPFIHFQTTSMKKQMQSSSLESSGQSAALMEAARHIFASEGLKGLSVRRVAELAGCTTMAVYSRFNGKSGILGALFDEGFDMLAGAQGAVKSSLHHEDRLLALCQAYRATAKTYPHHYALMLGQYSGELSPSEESRAKAMGTLNYLVDAVASLPSMKGQKRPACAEVANALFAFCHGWASLEKTGFLADTKKNAQAFERAILSLSQVRWAHPYSPTHPPAHYPDRLRGL
jgi:AcrR family transcriptional regulator